MRHPDVPSEPHPPRTACLGVVLGVVLLLSPRVSSQTGLPTGTVWLRIFSSARLEEAKQVQRILGAPGPEGGRVRQVFLRRGNGPEGTTLYEVVSGPYEVALDAVLEGLRLRGEPRFLRQGIRLDRLAVLLPSSFVPLPLRPDASSLKRLNPGGKLPYPVLGDVLVARALAFGHPEHALPSVEHATTLLDPFTQVLLLGEREVCAPSGRPCLRWFELLHPTLIQSVWIPANLVVRHSDLRSVELPEGTGRTKAKGALWRLGKGTSDSLYALMFRRGSLPPQRFTLALSERQAPPFTLRVDRHGPGIYNAEGKVVLRPTLGPWTYHRPPLWQLPTHLKAQLRKEPGPTRSAVGPARPPAARARPPAARDRPPAARARPPAPARPRARAR